MNVELALPRDRRSGHREALLLESGLKVLNRRTDESAGAIIVNAGEGGLQFTTDAEIRAGDALRLTFGQYGIAEIEGAVLWVRRNTIRILGNYTAGLVFRPAGQPGVTRILSGR